MTLDEAIKHCLEVAEENDLAAGTYEILAENNHNAYERLTAETNSSRCAECAADHRQLAEWLTELKNLREENKVLTSECDRLIKEKGELLKKSEQIAEYKRLLKSAIDEWPFLCEWGDCGEHCEWFANGKCNQEWCNKAEALALIGKEGENNASN